MRDPGRRLRAVHEACSPRTCNDRGMATTLLLVDDHEDFRRAARRMLESAGFEVVGEAADGHEALTLANELRPDVVLLDVQLPDLDGLEVAERIDAWQDGPDVVLISSREPAVYGGRVARSSARGFLSKAQLSGDALTAMLG
jgi:DNA-binding NarL/FixJ family response regulator